jgi:hypothetical protein
VWRIQWDRVDFHKKWFLDGDLNTRIKDIYVLGVGISTVSEKLRHFLFNTLTNRDGIIPSLIVSQDKHITEILINETEHNINLATPID